MKGRGDFSRQSFLGAGSEEFFADSRVVIIGLGGGGSHVAQQLAHLGVGHFRLIDPDKIEASNLNRLVSGTQKDVDDRVPKVRILERTIQNIRPWADVVVAESQWQEALDLVADAHVVFGCVDSYIQRQYIERTCRRFSLPYLDIGMSVTGIDDRHFAVAGQMIMSLPGESCMTCMGFLKQEKLNLEEDRYGDAGSNPQVVWTNGILASLAVGSFVQISTPWCRNAANYLWLEVDGNQQVVCHSRQPEYNIKGECTHFGSNDMGDPFYKLQV